MTHIQEQNWKKICPLNTPHLHKAYSARFFFFQTRVATTCRLNYNGQESKTTFAVYHCDVHVTLKQGPSHEIWYEFLAKQGYIIT